MTLLAGSIVQPGLYGGWGAAQWTTEFGYMRQVRMTHIVLQWTVDSTAGRNWTYYPTKMRGFRQHNTVDAVGRAFAAAKTAGLTVWLGLNWTDDWWSKGTLDQTWLDQQFTIAGNAAKELWARYGAAYGPQIAGFYTPLEVDNGLWATGQTRIAAEWAKLAATVHAVGKPLMTAPYFVAGQDMGPQEYADAWSRMAAVAHLDVVAMQDGCGTDHCTPDQVAAWFGPLSAAIRAASPATKFWSDLETCTPGFTPGSLDRVWAQQAAAAPYVDGFTTFSFNHYDSPQQGHGDLFAQWSAHVNGVS